MVMSAAGPGDLWEALHHLDPSKTDSKVSRSTPAAVTTLAQHHDHRARGC